MKVRTRMMISFLLFGIVGFVYMIFFVDHRVKPVYLSPIENDLVDVANLLAVIVAKDTGDGPLNVTGMRRAVELIPNQKIDAMIYDVHKTQVDMRIYVTDHDGFVRFDSTGRDLGQNYKHWIDVNRTLKGEYGARATWNRTGEVPILDLYVGAPIRRGEQIIGSITVVKGTPEAFILSQGMRQEAFLGVGLATLLALVWGTFFTVWVTRPIRRLTEYVNAVKEGRRGVMPKYGSSDIGHLGRAFEEMRDALEGRKYVEGYVQTLTHEIKSPLSAIRGASELLQEEVPPERRQRFLQNIHKETERIQNIVDRLLELSSLESRKALKDPKEVKLGDVIAQLLEGMEPALKRAGVSVAWDREQAITVAGEHFLIQLALSNLLKNAVEFTPEGGTISIRFEEDTVSIQDSGPGVPDYALERVFERFYSLRRPGTGLKSSGLGLSIVKQIADLHLGEARLANAPEGGAVASLSFKYKLRDKKLTGRLSLD